MGYSIGQVAKKTGLSTHTLRYYEKEGLLPFVRKNGSGLRVFADSDIGWLEMIECLKGVGMPLKGIKQYIDWYREGDTTLPERLEMFKRQKQNLEQQMAMLNKHNNHDIETIFLMADIQNSFLSSSIVKDLSKHGGDITGLVPDEIKGDISSKLRA